MRFEGKAMFEELPKVRIRVLKQLLALFQEFKGETSLNVLQQKIRQKGFSRATSYDYANTIRFLNSLLPKPVANSISNQPLETPKETWQPKWHDMFKTLETIRSWSPPYEEALFGCFATVLDIICDSQLSQQEKRQKINVELNGMREVLLLIADENVRKLLS
jgi:hypothetical protein